MNRPLIVDAHLDLAWNHVRGRDITLPAAQQPMVHNETATIGLPDLRAGGVRLVVATLFSLPDSPEHAGYVDHAGAFDQANRQMTFNSRLHNDGEIGLVRERNDLPKPNATAAHRLPAIVLMEGADAMTLANESDNATPAAWFERGVRMVGLAWHATRWAGGTGAPGPLTHDGRKLVSQLDATGFIHDASHLAERSLDDLLDLATAPICASHSNCRFIVGNDPGGRHLPDHQINAIAQRGGVIGINLFDRFLLPAGEYGMRRATLLDVVAHIRHACDIIGDCAHVGIGTDLDGGFGREHIPLEIETAADLPKLGDALSTAHFTDTDIAAILGGNWLRFFKMHLPACS